MARRSIPEKVRRRVADRFGWICALCFEPIVKERPESMTEYEYRQYWGLCIDHVRPVWAGGSDEERNLQPAHRLCNVRAGSKRRQLAITTDEFEMGDRVWFEVYRQERAIRLWRDRSPAHGGMKNYINNRLMDSLGDDEIRVEAAVSAVLDGMDR